MSKRHEKVIHEGEYAAEVEIELIERRGMVAVPVVGGFAEA